MILTLRDLFLDSVEKSSQRLFISQGETHLTYQEAHKQALRRAQLLLAAGAQPQERVIILNQQPQETVLWLLACLLTGVVFVILQPDTSTTRLLQIVTDLDPCGAIDPLEEHAMIYQQSAHVRFHFRTIKDTQVTSTLAVCSSITILQTDPAFFIYTSGSTARPKAVIYPHQAALFVTTAVNEYLQNTANDRIGHLLALSFIYGLFQIFLAIQAQAAIIFLEKPTSPLQLLKQLHAQRITALPALRPLLMQMTRIRQELYQSEWLRYITSSGDALPPTLITATLEHFPHVRFFSMFGLSECGRALYMPPDKLINKPTSVGRPIAGTRALVVNDTGQVLGPNEVGELVIEGPHVMNGYWRPSEISTTRFVTGAYGQNQLYTGDLFWYDHEGDFYFVGRKDDLIKSRGYRISPREIESLLLEADAEIKECMVYGVDDALLGQAVHAEVIVNNPAHTVAMIFARCKANIEAHLQPTKITIVDALPVTATGKYDRRHYRLSHEKER